MRGEAIGKNIKKYREEKGYTKKQLAELVGISYNTIRTYECGSSNPSPYSLSIISIALGVSLLDIIND